MAGTITCDVYARGYNTETGWIPYPVSKVSPQLGVELSLDEILELLTHSEIWIYDGSTHTNINTNNLNTYFPEFIPPYNRGGASGGSGGSNNVVTLTPIFRIIFLPSKKDRKFLKVLCSLSFCSCA